MSRLIYLNWTVRECGQRLSPGIRGFVSRLLVHYCLLVLVQLCLHKQIKSCTHVVIPSGQQPGCQRWLSTYDKALLNPLLGKWLNQLFHFQRGCQLIFLMKSILPSLVGMQWFPHFNGLNKVHSTPNWMQPELQVPLIYILYALPRLQSD